MNKLNFSNTIFITLLFYILLFSKIIHAQEYIHEGSIELKNQIQVNNFVNSNPKTTIIIGNLIIGDYAQKTNITDLSPLTQLLIIKGSLVIVNTQITTLTGLHKLLETGNLIIGKNNKLTSLIKLEVLEKIHGTLHIDGNSLLTDLTGLEQIVQIGDSLGGYLQISVNKSLKSVEGLNNLQIIPENMNISYNDSLSSLEALSSVKYIGQSLVIRKNNSLESLMGLDAIAYVGQSVSIENNESLASLKHLGNFDTIQFHLIVSDNPSLTSLEGLENIRWCNDDATISGNEQLISFTGLDNLKHIDGSLEIDNNPKLVNLNGLNNLEYIRANLEITNNENFNSFNGIGNLSYANGVYIVSNPKLFNCGIKLICDIIKNDKYIWTSDNKEGCNSVDQVSKACGNVNIIIPETMEESVNININHNMLCINTAKYEIKKISVFEITGNLVIFKTFSSSAGEEVKFNIGELSQGTYIIKINTNQKPVTKKIVVQ